MLGHRPKAVLTVLCFLAFLVTAAIPLSTAVASDKHERRSVYTGPKLSAPTVICKASQLAAGGFWRSQSGDKVHEGARIEKESKPTYRRVAISPQTETAVVIRFNANREALEAPVDFSAELTAGGGLLLVKKAREIGTSPEVISIDPVNSSFVYSSQHVNPLYNRANIWYGSCAPSE